jgi:hypothetical protein
MALSRRDLLMGLAGVAAGGAVTAAGGLSYRAWRRANNKSLPPSAKHLQGSQLADWVLTDDDRAALAQAGQIVPSKSLTLHDNRDIPGGGDYRSTRVASLGDCVEACEADSKCNGFTFARLSHPLPEKRQMCWLKGDSKLPDMVASGDYVSGVRR